MPGWAIAAVVTIVAGTGGYIVRMLVKISNTLGNIDAKMDEYGRRIDTLERLHPRTNRSNMR